MATALSHDHGAGAHHAEYHAPPLARGDVLTLRFFVTVSFYLFDQFLLILLQAKHHAPPLARGDVLGASGRSQNS